MPATEQYQVDIFSILILIACVLNIVFLIVAAIYFYDLMNFKPPTSGESSFLFWTSIILAVIFFMLGIYALIKIFTHKSIVYEEVKPQVPIQQVQQVPIQQVQQVPIQQVQQVPIQQVPIQQVQQVPNREYSDMTLTKTVNNSLNQELMYLSNSYSDA